MQITKSLQKTQTLKVFKIQRTCVYDGPGIRTTIFFQGCNLRCLWCQNPEGQPFQGTDEPDCNYSLEEIMDVVSRDKAYYQPTSGGVTLSGGEPLMQDPEILVRLLKRLKKESVNVSAETTLHVPWKSLSKVAPYIDLFLVDLKVVGDDDLHVKYTKQDSKLIHDNIKRLLDLKANIKFRMVMVPGYTDGEKNVLATSDFLKSIKYDSIELMRYNSLYEDKAKQLGLEVMPLHVTPEQSLASVKRGVELFTEQGISAENAELDSTLHKATFTQRVKDVQKDIREAGRALCMEVAKLKTEYYKKNGFKKPAPIHRAERLSHVLRHKTVKVYPGELLVGNFTAERVGGQLWEEHYGVLGIMFLPNINRQKPVPFRCSFEDRLHFYFKIFPFWFKHGLVGKVYPRLWDFIENIARIAELNAGFNNNGAAIAHFIVNYEPILKLGTSGLIEQIRAKQGEMPADRQDFYNGAVICLEAVEAYAQRYAEQLSTMSQAEGDPQRREELEEMAAICRHVPKHPARTFHEALQSMMFLQMALCIETYENALSFGRLDQILYPYYKKDKEAGIITYEKAKELICLFILKMDEAIFVNDGDSILSVYKLFETLSTDQTVTFGGVDTDGKDATNDLTYMLVDACELEPLAVDMTARIHKDSPARYLERLAEVYISGCPQPKLNSDDVYIESIQRHYPTSLAHARNYAIVGCVEPNASDDHFGNTDCANVNLAMPLLQAIKGHEHDLWHFGLVDRVEKLLTQFVEYFFKGKGALTRGVLTAYNKALTRRRARKGLFKYNPPSSMDELLDRFQRRLNVLTKSVLADHQLIERALRKDFPTPLSSALFKGCLESGKDLYDGGASLNSSGIQAVGVTDVADSLHAIHQVVFKKHLYTMEDVVKAVDANFEGEHNRRIRAALLAVPKFGDDSSSEATDWVTRVMHMYNVALDSVPNCPRDGRYSAGYYALNVAHRYGQKTQALPSGRPKGVPLANSVTPHYGMRQNDLLSSLNSIAGVDFVDHAENGTTVTFTIDASLFQGRDGVKNLASIFQTFLTTGGMQLQPNVVNREVLMDAYKHPEKHRYLMVRIAGYCAYFYELSDELKLSIINRTCYSS
ncbi:MAG: radical SAM protein [Candidatus Lokiarchaeota archaeon]|nr:radical SAM protein [Candidatus Lokiarchaeota archaeon]